MLVRKIWNTTKQRKQRKPSVVSLFRRVSISFFSDFTILLGRGEEGRARGRAGECVALTYQRVDHAGFAGDVGEAHVDALVAVGEPAVVDAELLEHGGLQVIDVDGVADRLPADFVGFAVCVTASETTAGEEHREGGRVVVASCDSTASRTIFSQRGTAEFTADDDHRFVEQAALLEVVDQCCNRLINHRGVVGEVASHVAVVIPRGKDNVDEPDAAFDHTSGQQAIGGKRTVLVADASTFGSYFWLGTVDAVVF